MIMSTRLVKPSAQLKKRVITMQQGKTGPAAALSAMAVVSLAHQVDQALAAHFARYGLTQARFVLMLTMHTAAQKRHRPAELAKTMGVKPPTITGLLNGLARDGLISRRLDRQDKRQVLVSLTARGKRELRKILPDHFMRINSAFANLALAQARHRLDATIRAVELSLDKLCGGQPI